MNINLRISSLLTTINKCLVLTDKLINKLTQQENNILILWFLLMNLLEQFFIFFSDLIKLVLSFLLFSLIIKNSLLKKLSKVGFVCSWLLLLIFASFTSSRSEMWCSHWTIDWSWLTLWKFILGNLFSLLDLFFDKLDLCLIFLNNSVTEMRSFGKLLLYFRVFIKLNF